MKTGQNVTYRRGSKAFLVENSRAVRTVTVLSVSGGLYKVKFDGGGGTCVRESRLYETEQEARAAIDGGKVRTTGFRSPHL